MIPSTVLDCLASERWMKLERAALEICHYIEIVTMDGGEEEEDSRSCWWHSCWFSEVARLLMLYEE